MAYRAWRIRPRRVQGESAWLSRRLVGVPSSDSIRAGCPSGTGGKHDLTHGAGARGAHGVIGVHHSGRWHALRCARDPAVRVCPDTGTRPPHSALGRAQVKVCLFSRHSGRMSSLVTRIARGSPPTRDPSARARTRGRTASSDQSDRRTLRARRGCRGARRGRRHRLGSLRRGPGRRRRPRPAAVDRQDPAPAKGEVEHDLEGPVQQAAGRSSARPRWSRSYPGDARSRSAAARRSSSSTSKKYVELGREKTDKIFTILVEFGDQVDDTTMYDPDGPDGPKRRSRSTAATPARCTTR